MKLRYRWIALVLAVSSAWAGPARAHPCADMPEGFHEWGAFGERSVFLYHFPMFGSIHSYQVLVKADLLLDGKNVNDLFFAARAANPSAIFVISPAKIVDGAPDYWILPEYSREGAVFNAKLHFRDSAGKANVLFERVSVTVRSVLINRLMNSPKEGSPHPEHLGYFYFGDSNEAYLAHRATWDPDFDQFVRVKPVALPSACSGASPLVVFSDRADGEPSRLKPGESLDGAASCGLAARFQVLEELFEFKIDLQH